VFGWHRVAVSVDGMDGKEACRGPK